MNYIKVNWIHSFPDEPVLLYSELDEHRWEKRKVEIYNDGRMGYADSNRSTANTRLSEEPIPPIAVIAADVQFKPEEVSKEEFEAVWVKAVR